MPDIRVRDLVRTEEGLISRRIFFDPEIYRAELENVFARCWLYLAHESQIPAPGDYTTNYMGEDPVLIWRGLDGEVRAFLNSCRHRGMRVCRTDAGNARQFACPFHGWTYGADGSLKTVPSLEEGYFGALDRGSWGLRRVPKLAKEMGPEVVEYVEECHARLVALSQVQADVYALPFGNLFPNFSINDFSALRPVGLYLWTPKGPGRLEVWQWAATDRDAPRAVKDIARVDFARGQATSGIFGPDDTENFEQVTQSTAGAIGQRLDFNYRLTLGGREADAPDGVPGYVSSYPSEENQRRFYRRYADLMDGGADAQPVYEKPRLAASG